MRVIIFGGAELHASATVLGLGPSDAPELALIDLRDRAAVADAAALPHGLLRIVIAGADQRALARALAIPDDLIAPSCDPATLGPLIAAAAPAPRPRPTRLVVVTSARGGTGRTLLVTNLARRLASRLPTLVVDGTGSGAAGWWLGVRGRPWSDIEGLAGELTSEQLAVVAEQAGVGLRVVGGAPRAPSVELVTAVVRAATGAATIVLVDAPVLADERTRALLGLAERSLVLSYDDALSRDLLDIAEVPNGVWHLASQWTGGTLGPDFFLALPRDERAVSVAADDRRSAGGALGRSYDLLADLVAEDVGR